MPEHLGTLCDVFVSPLFQLILILLIDSLATRQMFLSYLWPAL
jgi:hypothetical protein